MRYPPSNVVAANNGKLTPAQCQAGRVAHPLIFAAIKNTAGCPVLRVLCEGRESDMPAPLAFLTQPGRETKSPSSLHSRTPDRFRPTDRSDNCSSAIVLEKSPGRASPDCDAYTAVFLPACESSIR